MSNLTDFFPSGGGGGLTPKFEEFNASGTFTPTQALIDAGGYIEVFLVGGGAQSTTPSQYGGSGGSVISFNDEINSVNGITVTIAASSSGSGNSSSYNATAAGGKNIVAAGGNSNGTSTNTNSASWGNQSFTGGSLAGSAGTGTFGYGAGGSGTSLGGRLGIRQTKANTGQGGADSAGASGYCLIKWYE